MARMAWFAAAAFAAHLLPSTLTAQPNSTTVDYIVVQPDSACTRITPGGIDQGSVTFGVVGWNRGPNGVAQNQAGDDVSLGFVPVTWALPDSVFDAHSGRGSLTESPTGQYGNAWNVTATIGTSFNLTAAASATLDFWHHYDLETNWDFGRVEVNSGAGWTEVAIYTGVVGSPEGYVPVSVNLAAFLGQTIDIRFRVQTDGSITREGWVIDDVVVRANAVDLFNDDLESGLTGWTLTPEWGLSLPTTPNQLGTIFPSGKYVAGGVTGTTVIRAIYNGTLEASAHVDVYPPDWVP